MDSSLLRGSARLQPDQQPSKRGQASAGGAGGLELEQPTTPADAPLQPDVPAPTETGMNQQDLARGLAEWLGQVRQRAPGLSLTSLEAFLWVASGANSSDMVRARMQAGAPLARPTVTRVLGLLRGRGQWRSDHWVTPLDWLVGRPHPHTPGAIAYRLSKTGRSLLASLGTHVLPPAP